MVQIFVRKCNVKLELKISNIYDVSNLKKSILKIKDDLIPSVEKIRLFFGGKELQDNKRICDYKIEEGDFIQMG